MPFDNTNTPRRDIVAERMAAMSRPKPELVVPDHLKGVLFSPRDLFAPTLAKADAELRAYLASHKTSGKGV